MTEVPLTQPQISYTKVEMAAQAASVEDNEYTNWLSVNLALHYMKSGVHTFIKGEVDCLHQMLVQKIYGGQTVSLPPCTICHASRVKRDEYGVWAFKKRCRSDCDAWLAELLALHVSPKSEEIYWCNSHVPSWPFCPWECAKIFMPRGQLVSSAGPIECDANGLLTLLASCKHFHHKLSPQGLGLLNSISTMRDKVMHNDEMKVSDGERKSFLQDIVQLLEDPVHLKSLEDCKAAVRNIHKIDNDSLDVHLEMKTWRAVVNEFTLELGFQDNKKTLDTLNSLKEEYKKLRDTALQQQKKHQNMNAVASHDVENQQNVCKELRVYETSILTQRGKNSNRKRKTAGQRISDSGIPEKLCWSALNRCLPDLKKDLDFELVSLHIQQKELFPDVTLRDIKEQGTTSEKIERLIQEVQKGGQNTYEKFKECLVLAGQIFLKDMLEEEEKGAIVMDIEMPKGSDGIICVTKHYPDLKENMSKASVKTVATGLLDRKLISQDEYDRFINPIFSRRRCIDMLLKKVIRGEPEKSKLLNCFIELLFSQHPDMAMKISKTEVTEKDRTEFCQVNQNIVVKRNAHMTSPNSFRATDTEIVFFQKHLCDSPEHVDSINDKLLSNFYISIADHSIVLQSEDKMIPTLFDMVQYYHLNDEAVYKIVLEQSLFEEWKTMRYGNHGAEGDRTFQTLRLENPDNTAQGSQGILDWMKKATRTVLNGFARLFQSDVTAVDKGSIVLKLRVWKDLKLELLDKEFVGKSLRRLIRIGCFQSKVHLRGPVLVTVYILSPEAEDQKEEIHFHLDLEAIKNDVQQPRGSHRVHWKSQDIKLLAEEMDPIGLQHWMFDQLKIDPDVPCQNLSRHDQMEVLLSIIKRVENGFDMLAQYCKENDQHVVYTRVFEKQDQLFCPGESETDQTPVLLYDKGGLQKLYSMKLDMDIEEQGMNDFDMETYWETYLMDKMEEEEYVDDKERNKSNYNRVEEEKFSDSDQTAEK